MAQLSGATGMTAEAVAAMIEAKAALSAPPAVALNSDKGQAQTFARADHTHQSRLQARRIQVTPDANGRYVYTFPLAYDVSTVPIIGVTAETPAGVSYRNDASILQDSITATQATILVTRIPQAQTVSVLGATLTLVQPVTTPVWVNIMSRAPS